MTEQIQPSGDFDFDFDFDLENIGSIYDAIVVRDGFIHLHPTYPIALSRCDTAEKLLAWVCHLSSKPWFHERRLTEGFNKTSARENGIRLSEPL